MNKRTAETIQRVETVAAGLLYAADDLDRMLKSNDGLIYNFDLSFLDPQLFNERHGRLKKHLDTRQRVHRILQTAPADEHVQIAVSGATLLEFIDQLGHLHHNVQDALARLERGGKSFVREALTSTNSVHARLVQVLDFMTERGRQDLVEPVRRFIQLTEAGSIVGLEDLVDVDAITPPAVGQFEELLAEQCARRLPRETDRREEDALFHYKVDTSNVLITVKSVQADSESVFFVTPTPISREQCQLGDNQYSRVETVPLIVLNTNRLAREESIGESGMPRTLRRLAREGFAFAEEVREAGNIEQLNLREMSDQMHYLEGTVPYTNSTPLRPQTRQAPDPSQRLEEVLELVDKPDRLAEAAESSREAVREGARLIYEIYESNSASYLDAWNLHDDPVVQRRRREMGLN